jgi:hypothetical protein
MHFAVKYRTMNNSRNILSIVLFGFLLTGCSKDPIEQLSFPAFTASVNGVHTEFMAPVTARSIQNASGGYDLRIVAENRINIDSSVLIIFTIADFTRGSTKKVTHPLNTSFDGNFVEWRTTVPSTQGKYHYYQQGSLTVEQDVNGYLKGSFDFVYFLFDKQGNKIGEVTVSNGQFSDIIIER